MFLGEYQHSLDNKGRLTLPARFRADLGDAFVATKGMDNCLFIYPLSEWKVIEQKMRTLPITSSDARAFVRFFLSGASECELDNQGRVVIASNLREYAGIDKDVTVIGVGTRVEVWARDKWEGYAQGASASYEAIAENLVDLGI